MTPTNKTQYLAVLLGLVGKHFEDLTKNQEVAMVKAWNCLADSGDLPALQHAHALAGHRIVEIVQNENDNDPDSQIAASKGHIDDIINELHTILEAE
tara:strand:+ start:323 stop:613 length:291 start_codon:yes stop_codon:yes gene_type:complete